MDKSRNNQKSELEKNPTPSDEFSGFQTPDEKALDAAHKRGLEEKAAEQGPLGRLIGSSDSILNTCWGIILGALAVQGITAVAMILSGALQTEALHVISLLFALQSFVAGYLMGKGK